MHGIGFDGAFLNSAVSYVMGDKKKIALVLDDVDEFDRPLRDSFVVGTASVIGSLIPLVSFLFFPVMSAFWISLAVSTVTLFVAGFVKGIYTNVNRLKSAVELSLVGIFAALAGFIIGSLLGALPA